MLKLYGIDELKLYNMDKFIYSDYESRHFKNWCILRFFVKNLYFFLKKVYLMSRNIDASLHNLFLVYFLVNNWSIKHYLVEKKLSNGEVCFEMKYIENMLKKNT